MNWKETKVLMLTIFVQSHSTPVPLPTKRDMKITAIL